ncbi:L-ribulose-5-phosphate 3-epimerase UlaE [subsurface metagenome]
MVVIENSVKLGAVCFAEYEGDYLDFLKLCYNQGLCWVEFKYENPVSGRERSAHTDKIKEKAVRLGLGLSVHTRFQGFNIGSLQDEERNDSLHAIIESLNFAHDVGAHYATVHAGDLASEDYSKENYKESFNRSIAGLKSLQQEAEARGITLCVENGNGFVKSKLKHAVIPADLKRIRRLLANKIHFTLDMGHGTYFSTDPSYLVSELGIANVKLAHLHDNNGEEDSHRPLGEGVIQVEKIFRRYVEEGWSFPLSLELKSTEHLVESINYARDIISTMEYEVCQIP